MSTSGETADQVIRMSLNGVEVAARLSGTGVKNLAVMLYAILNDQQRTKGKVRLESLLRSGKELKVFTIKESDLKVFCQEAKKYGVLYCVIRDKEHPKGETDILVRAEDASKINRIIERFGLATVNHAQVSPEVLMSNPTRQRPVRKKSQSVPTSDSRKPAGISFDAPESQRPSIRQLLRSIRNAAEYLSPAPERSEYETR